MVRFQDTQWSSASKAEIAMHVNAPRAMLEWAAAAISEPSQVRECATTADSSLDDPYDPSSGSGVAAESSMAHGCARSAGSHVDGVLVGVVRKESHY